METNFLKVAFDFAMMEAEPFVRGSFDCSKCGKHLPNTVNVKRSGICSGCYEPEKEEEDVSMSLLRK